MNDMTRQSAINGCYNALRRAGVSPLRAVAHLRFIGVTLDEAEAAMIKKQDIPPRTNASTSKNKKR